MIQLPVGFSVDEQYNILMTSGDGEWAGWFRLPGPSGWAEIRLNPSGPPYMRLRISQLTPAELRQRILSECASWVVVRWDVHELDKPTSAELEAACEDL